MEERYVYIEGRTDSGEKVRGCLRSSSAHEAAENLSHSLGHGIRVDFMSDLSPELQALLDSVQKAETVEFSREAFNTIVLHILKEGGRLTMERVTQSN